MTHTEVHIPHPVFEGDTILLSERGGSILVQALVQVMRKEYNSPRLRENITS